MSGEAAFTAGLLAFFTGLPAAFFFFSAFFFAGFFFPAFFLDHSAGTFIYDPAGRLRLFAAYGQGAAKMSHDIRLLLQGQ